MARLNLNVFASAYSARTVYNKTSGSHLDKHQTEIMQKGLPRKRPIPGVKHIVVVASGKGGVGKSTTAVNLAVALKKLDPDKEIGLLDTDVFGPTVPLMMNLHDTPLLTSDNLLVPLVNYGIKCMSMGFLISETSPVVWRGLMVMSALDKLLRHVSWRVVDILVVDTPPGTGDTQLSLVQNVPLSGVLLVTTPQVAALQVTHRGAAMFQKLGVPVLGLVGNMSCVMCSQCGHVSHPFGSGTQQLATQLDVPLLVEVPLHPSISEGGDSGKPTVISTPTSLQALAYMSLAEKVLIALNAQSNTASGAT